VKTKALARATLALLCVSAGLTGASGGQTLSWRESPSNLARGKADGMAVSSRGRLFPSPRLERVDASGTTLGPAHIWALAADSVGNVYLGTGPDGQVLRIDAAGVTAELYVADEPMVSAVTIASDGDVVIATSPGGRLYRVAPDGSARLWAEVEERYVWTLAVGPGGEMYAGTGERGRVLRIHRSGSTEVVFDSDEFHIVSLLALPDGGLLAGGAGRGLVYRIDPEGHALVLYDDELPEVSALALEPDGSVAATLVAAPELPSRRPALRLRLPDGVQVGSTDETVGMLEESTGPTLFGTIEGLADVGEEEKKQRARGRVVRIGAEGTSRELWSSATEVPFCLALDDSGRLLFGTGEPARLYRVDPDDDIARLTTLDEAQLTGLVNVAGTVYLGTSNPAATYRLEPDASTSSLFVSRPFDAGALARWGSIRWSVENPSGRTELYTRTGNSREPDGTWSAWSPAMTRLEGSPVVNPDGRYLQWRVRQVGGRPRLANVTVSYEPYNRPPSLREFRLAEGRHDGTKPLKFLWSARDPDGDPVEVTLQYRLPGGVEWSTAVVAPGERRTVSRTEWHEASLEWPTESLAEGAYDVRAVASDQPGNAEGEGKQHRVEPAVRVVVDRTPPRVALGAVEGSAREVVVEDLHSDILRLELIREGRVRFTARPEDGICDSNREVFRVELPAGEQGWVARGVDAAGNSGEQALDAGSRSSF